MKRPKGHGLASAGFTLSEMAIASVVLVVVSGAIMGTLRSLQQLTETGDVQSELQSLGERALTSIMDDLRYSGFGDGYPYLFEGGVTSVVFDAHAHEPHIQHVDADHAFFGASQEIVFRLPADEDPADGRPDVDDGVLVWSDDDVSYTVVTMPDGINYLQRRVNGASPRNVSHHVERIVFDDNASSGFEVPLESIRVRIDFLKEDADRHPYRYSVEATVRLRNGVGLLE